MVRSARRSSEIEEYQPRETAAGDYRYAAYLSIIDVAHCAG